MHDVMVIGGGPVGSQVAGRLAGMGYRVAVLEQKEAPGIGVCCTGIISHGCARYLAIDDDLILRQVNSARLISPAGRVLRLYRQETQACILDRAALDLAMVRRAQDRGAEYMFSSPARDLKVGADKVVIKALRDDKEVSLDARTVIIACGFNSRLVEVLGLGNISHFVLGAQVEVETAALDEIEVYFGDEVAPGFFAWLVPTTPFRARVGLLSRRSPGLYLRRLVSSLRAQGKVSSSAVEICYGRVPLRPLARTHYDRLLVVGTAAGQVKPTTGGGLYYGLLCADIAASALHQALDGGDLSARGLAGYEREWRGKLGQELKRGYRVRRFYEHLNDQQIDRLFTTMEVNAMADVLLSDEGVSFDWHSSGLLKILGSVAASRIIKAAGHPFRFRNKA